MFTEVGRAVLAREYRPGSRFAQALIVVAVAVASAVAGFGFAGAPWWLLLVLDALAVAVLGWAAVITVQLGRIWPGV